MNGRAGSMDKVMEKMIKGGSESGGLDLEAV